MSTASGIHREMECPPSEALPHTYSTGPQAESGNAVHEFIDQVRNGADRQALLDEMDEDAPHRAICEAIDFERIPAGAESEVALAWEPSADAGRVLGRRLGRDYGRAQPGELVGTADLLGRVGDQIFVADFKTGKAVTGGAKGAWQMRFLALAAARAAGLRSARVQLLYPRADGRMYPDEATFDRFDLLAFRDELRGMIRRTEEAKRQVASGTVPPVHEGPWCRYCPAFSVCPAKRDVIVSLVKRAEEAPSDAQLHAQIDALSPAAVGMVAARVEAAKQYLKRVDEVIDMYARRQGDRGVPLPDGRVLKEVPSSKRFLNGQVASDVLWKLDEAEPEERRIAMKAVQLLPETSAAAIRRALSSVGRKPKEAEKILEEIGRANGFIVKTSLPVKAVAAGELAIPDAQDETQQAASRRIGG